MHNNYQIKSFEIGIKWKYNTLDGYKYRKLLRRLLFKWYIMVIECKIKPSHLLTRQSDFGKQIKSQKGNWILSPMYDVLTK